MTPARERAREAALVYSDSRFNTGQRGALEHAADAASRVWEPLLKGALESLQDVLTALVNHYPVDEGEVRSAIRQIREALDG